MSWAADDWTSGLTGRVLQKVLELQAQQERLVRERQQKQLQLDNAEATLQKNRRKFEEMRGEVAVLQREVLCVREEAQREVRVRERLAHDLQVKSAQVCSLEGQLDSAHKLNQTLTQEIKRLEAELERIQKGGGSGDSTLFTSTFEPHKGRGETTPGFRGGEEKRTQHVRLQLQFGDFNPNSSVSRSSSPFPQQPNKTPTLRRSVTASSMFPWERDDSRSHPKGATDSSPCDVPSKDSDSGDCGIEEAMKKEREAQQCVFEEVCERLVRVQCSLQAEQERCSVLEKRLGETQADLLTAQRSHTHTQDQLTRAHTRITQENDRAQVAEQRVKQLLEELQCQRQNTETSRQSAEIRRRDTEKEHHREVLELQRERQAMEKQHQQETTKLNLEIQQAKTQHHILQSQYDQLQQQQGVLQREVSEGREALRCCEAELAEGRCMAAQTLSKLTEALRERDGLAVCLEQARRKEKSLEEELKQLREELADTQRLISELQARLLVAPPPLGSGGRGVCAAGGVQSERSPPRASPSHRRTSGPAGRVGEGAAPSGGCREPAEGMDSDHMGQEGGMEARKSEVRAGQEGKADSVLVALPWHEGETSGGGNTAEEEPHPDREGRGRGSAHGAAQELQRENGALRVELQEVREELRRRLDDLEEQRKVEAQVRSKLRQLVRARGGRVEEAPGLEAQLLQEREEGHALRAKLSLLEREMQEGATLIDNLTAKEQGMEEECKQVKEELAKLQSVIDQEREEREKERQEEKKRVMKKEREGGTTLTAQIEELQAELNRVKKENAPLTYLQLANQDSALPSPDLQLSNQDSALPSPDLQRANQDSALPSPDLQRANQDSALPSPDLQRANQDSALPSPDLQRANQDSALPSPDIMLSFCQSANLHNTMVSMATNKMANLITDYESLKSFQEHAKHSPEDRPSTAAAHGDVFRCERDRMRAELDRMGEELDQMGEELYRVKAERDKEAEHNRQSQRRLEALQQQVTQQAQQLTQAFDSQSLHVHGLLAELQQRHSAALCLDEELQLCREELVRFKTQEQKARQGCGADAPPTTETRTGIDAQRRSVAMETEQPSELQPLWPGTAQQEATRGQQSNTCNASATPPLPNPNTFASPATGNGPTGTGALYTAVTAHTILPTDAVPSQTTLPTDDVTSHIALPADAVIPHTALPTDAVIPHTAPPMDAVTLQTALHSDAVIPHTALPSDAVIPHTALPADAVTSHTSLPMDAVTSHTTLTADVVTSQPSLPTDAVTSFTILATDIVTSHTALLADALTSHNTPPTDAVIPQTLITSHPELPAISAVAVGVAQPGRGGADRMDAEVQIAALTAAASNQNTVSPDAPDFQHMEPTKELELQQKLPEGWADGRLPGPAHPDPPRSTGPPATEPKLTPHTKPAQEATATPVLEPKPAQHTQPGHMQTRSHVGVRDGAPTGQEENPVAEHAEEERRAAAPAEVSSLEEQVLLLQVELHSLSEQNKKQGEELQLWRLAALSPGVMADHHGDGGPVVLVREDQVLLSCNTGQLHTLRQDMSRSVKRPVGSEPNGDWQPALSDSQSPAPCPPAVTPQDPTEMESGEGSRVESDLVPVTPQTRLAELTPQNQPEDISPLHQITKVINTDGSTVSTRDGSSPMATHTSAGPGQGSEVRVVRAEDEGEEARERKSAATQTEGTNQQEATPILRLVHTSTQTEQHHGNHDDDDDDAAEAESPPLSPTLPTQTVRPLSGSFPIPADPAHLAERIRRSRARMSAAYDDTEYEPYGLPEVVMKGFADIPQGPACPYVLRRGLLGTSSLPLRTHTEEEEEEP